MYLDVPNLSVFQACIPHMLPANPTILPLSLSLSLISLTKFPIWFLYLKTTVFLLFLTLVFCFFFFWGVERERKKACFMGKNHLSVL